MGAFTLDASICVKWEDYFQMSLIPEVDQSKSNIFHRRLRLLDLRANGDHFRTFLKETTLGTQ